MHFFILFSFCSLTSCQKISQVENANIAIREAILNSESDDDDPEFFSVLTGLIPLFLALGIAFFYVMMSTCMNNIFNYGSMRCHKLHVQKAILDKGLNNTCSIYNYGGWYYINTADAESPGSVTCTSLDCCFALNIWPTIAGTAMPIIFSAFATKVSIVSGWSIAFIIVLLFAGAGMLFLGFLGVYPCLRTGKEYPEHKTVLRINRLRIVQTRDVTLSDMETEEEELQHSTRICNKMPILVALMLIKYGAGFMIGSFFGIICVICLASGSWSVVSIVVLILVADALSVGFLTHLFCCFDVCSCCWCTCCCENGCYDYCFPVLPCHDKCFTPIAQLDSARRVEVDV